MKYKVGDKVRIKSIEWYEKNKDKKGYIKLNYNFSKKMSEYCGKIVTIMHVLPNCYWLVETSDNWTDEMIDETYDFKQLAIGEVFDYKGHKLKVEKAQKTSGCKNCFFEKLRLSNVYACNEVFKGNIQPSCCPYQRNDKNSVIFKEINMEQRTIKVDICTARKWYNGDDESLKELALQVFSKEELEKDELPNSWKEFCEKNREIGHEYYIASDSQISCTSGGFIRDNVTDRILVPNKAHAQGILALCQLTQLRDCYRQGWKPDRDDNENKYIIEYVSDDLSINFYMSSNKFLSFQSEKIRDKFLENFRDIIEQAKEYI